MGREVRCLVSYAGEEAEAKALLETDEVIVRSPFRLRIPLADITQAEAVDGRLALETAAGPVLLELGEREAARWAHAIANPKTLADKLGVKPGQRVRLVGAVPPELAGAGEVVADGDQADVVFVALDDAGELPLLGQLREGIARDGAIWAIRPKGRPDLTEAMVLEAGRGAGLTDIKTARISATHTGEKFVIPVADR
jgi:hypothetical protein